MMIAKGMLGILTGGAVIALAANSYGIDAAGVLGPGSTPGMLMMLGLGLLWVGKWGRKRICRGGEGK
jgi:hypothetical protein